MGKRGEKISFSVFWIYSDRMRSAGTYNYPETRIDIKLQMKKKKKKKRTFLSLSDATISDVTI